MTAHTTLQTNRPGRQLRHTRDRNAIERDLSRQLAILAARHDTGEIEEPQLGLVLQAHRNIGDSYPTWRASWVRRLRQIKSPDGRGMLTAERWPEHIAEDGWGLLLLCVTPGTTSMVDRSPKVKTATTSTRSRREVLLATPLAAQTTSAAMIHQTSADLMGMDLIHTMLGFTPDLLSPQLAPPVLEWVTADARRALDRKVITWDLPWPLPAPRLG